MDEDCADQPSAALRSSNRRLIWGRQVHGALVASCFLTPFTRRSQNVGASDPSSPRAWLGSGRPACPRSEKRANRSDPVRKELHEPSIRIVQCLAMTDSRSRRNSCALHEPHPPGRYCGPSGQYPTALLSPLLRPRPQRQEQQRNIRIHCVDWELVERLMLRTDSDGVLRPKAVFRL